jgi:uncharacterized protein YkwD
MPTPLIPRALGTATLALLATLALSSCGAPQSMAVAPPSPSAGVSLNAEESRFVELLNAERGRAGLAPLAVHAGVVDVARGWAGELARRGSLAHNPNLTAQVGATTSWVKIGENVGMGADVDSVHQALMASSPHRRNMLDGAFDLVGVGVVRSGSGIWMSMVFVGV